MRDYRAAGEPTARQKANARKAQKEKQRIKQIVLPTPHPVQEIFVNWSEENPNAQCLIAPCGTKLGKSFGCTIWLLTEALSNPGLFCCWIGPTYLKCKIGYRYMRAMLPDIPDIKFIESKLEIRFGNGSVIKFLHGHDAETTVEGEAIDRFVIDEASKQTKQLFHSLLTTITQTQGKGIITGTPRGHNWYYDEFRKAKAGDPFYVWAQLKTEQSPFITKKAVEQARRLLPSYLFAQYYLAEFVSHSETFGDYSTIFDNRVRIKTKTKFWIHPDESKRAGDVVIGWDIAKKKDFSVFVAVNMVGEVVGYARFHGVGYDVQVDRLKYFAEHYFKGDRTVRYDATGVGDAVGDIIVSKDIDADIRPVVFGNRSKQEMVTSTTVAIENSWLKSPFIEDMHHEMGAYEVSVTKTGLYSYAAAEGEHDDIVSALILAVSGAFAGALSENNEKMIQEMLAGKKQEDIIADARNPFEDEIDDDFSFEVKD